MPAVINSSLPSEGQYMPGYSRGAADDLIYPVHILDGAKYQHCILTLFVRFNDILDPGKIKESLKRLLEIGDWRKLGGRFRTKLDDNANSGAVGGAFFKPPAHGLEIHVPREYTAERPAIQFAHETHELSIFDHPLGQQLPQTTAQDSGAVLSPPLDSIRLCGQGPGFPITMADLVDKDMPQLCFKVIGFTDATILAVTFSHCTWDISGLQGFMKSFELVLDGREEEVPAMLGARTDILTELAGQYDGGQLDPALLSMALGQGRLGKQQQQQQRPSTALGTSGHGRTDLQERILRMPLNLFQRLHVRAWREQQADGDDDDEYQSAMCQPDELFLALILQAIARAQPPTGRRPLKVLNIFNARLLVPQLAAAASASSSSPGIYSQNLVLLAPRTLSHADAAGPMAATALAQRECFADAAVPRNVARSLCTILGAIAADLDITALTDCGDEDSVLVNNLVKLSSYIDVDLSAAVLRQGDRAATRRNGLGTADLLFLTLPASSYGMMRVTTVGSYNGNACWLFGELPARAWELIHEAITELEV